METTPPLPSGFNINGYLIQSLKQTDALCHVYYASDANHVQYLVREFCPQGLAVRDPESGKLRYPETTDIEQEVLPLKNDFEAQFRTGSLGENSRPGHHVPGLCPARRSSRRGAVPASGYSRGAPPARPENPGHSRSRSAPRPCGTPFPAPEKEKLRRHLDPYPDSAGRRLRRLLLHAEACGGLRRPAGTVQYAAQKEKKEAPKPEKKAALPAAEVEDPFEQESAAAEAPRVEQRNSRKKRRPPVPLRNRTKTAPPLPRKNLLPNLNSLPERRTLRQTTPRLRNSRNRKLPPNRRMLRPWRHKLPSNPPPPAVRAEKPPGRPPTWGTSTPT